MAEDKKSFVLYADLIHTVKKMPKAKAGELFLTILQYVNDENPVVKDKVVDLVFEPIKRQMKRDLVKYEGIKEKRSLLGREGGLKSGEARRSKTKQLLQTSKQNEANEAVTVNVTVNDIIKDGSGLVETYFLDLPNSSNLENIARMNKIAKEDLIRSIPDFRKSAEEKYESFEKFVTHFKRWYFKNQEINNPIQGLKLKTSFGK